MRAICSWCRQQGQAGLIAEKPPLQDPTETHSICEDHLEELLASFPSRSFPGVEVLLVVPPKDTALFEHLRQRFAGVRGVKVIMDRRRGERRREERPVDRERRVLDRRVRRPEVSPLGYLVFRFAQKGPTRGGEA